MAKQNRGIGILYILGAAAGFACMNLFVGLAGELPTMQKVFFRNLIAAVIVFFLLLGDKRKFRIQKGALGWLFLRAGAGFLGVVLNFYAIDHIGSISDASILNKLSPFFAILFSVFLLKEKPRWWELLFVAIAFGGAMCVVRPTFDAKVLPALAGFCSGACAGLAYTAVRILGIKGERGDMTVFFFSAFSTLAALPFFIAYYTPMTWLQLVYLVMAGVSAAVGQFFITAAYRHAPAKEIAVFDYAQVPIAAVLGFFFLSELPDGWSFVGYAIIIGAAVAKWLVTLLSERRKRALSPAQQETEPLPQDPQAPAQQETEPPGGEDTDTKIHNVTQKPSE